MEETKVFCWVDTNGTWIGNGCDCCEPDYFPQYTCEDLGWANSEQGCKLLTLEHLLEGKPLEYILDIISEDTLNYLLRDFNVEVQVEESYHGC